VLIKEFDIQELTEIVSLRSDLLSRVLSLTRIGDRCKIVKSWLEVRGQLGTYQIHLGWAGVALMTDSRPRWLRIPQRVLSEVELDLQHVPLDLDYRTEQVLRKAYVLAEDGKINSPELVRQLMPE
jgi:hypothetical protein